MEQRFPKYKSRPIGKSNRFLINREKSLEY